MNKIYDHSVRVNLESRGYKINIDTMKFYELVKNNSRPSTIE